MKVIYQTTFTKIGNFAKDSLDENMLITFKQGAPEDLEDYCFIHNHGELSDNVLVGDVMELNGIDYTITAIGEVANINLRELGHVTWRFDNSEIAEYPGTIHIKGNTPTHIQAGDSLKIKRY
ncbi:MAG: PTS glucitol/sorbitol transporter subunit IIA [Pasteurellaceae bacterium]|nr:PTS glucitol/sorbitol transporter subunit IIA [Pasteurellaceae bacterium]